MRIIEDLAEMTETARGWLAGGMVGFVPVASELHNGHLVLIQAACESCEISVVSMIDKALLFRTSHKDGLVMQPRNLSRDLLLLDNTDVDVVFMPRPEEMYPAGFSMHVTPMGYMARQLRKAADGRYGQKFMTTMVKLFQLVRPDIVFFGQKDAVQVAIMHQLVRDLNIDVKLQVLPTVRENDGLAISSRNRMLSEEERRAAPLIYQALLQGKVMVEKGERQAKVITSAIADMLSISSLIDLDSIAICHPDSLVEVPEVERGTLITIGARVGRIYLTDNILLS
ncbi:MAG TPA: pantoate--beta-alanine ligase [Ktedonobacteraceae bacterium]|nr:pantoate--beta-alanine ligase [Ktedonobacteraceae bacterium]